MRIGIVGSGAMGSLFGGLLGAAGHEVWFLDVWAEHVQAIQSDGLLMTFRDERRVVHGHATTNPAEVSGVELAMVWSKSFATRRALDDALPMLTAETIVCSLQNGLGNVETIESVIEPDRVVYGVTGIGARTVGPGHIELTEGAWTGGSMTWISGRTALSREHAVAVASVLRDAGIAMEVPDDIEAIIWNKLAMSAAMGSVAAVLRAPSAQVLDSRDGCALIEASTREIAAVAAAGGTQLDTEAAIKRNFEVYETTRGHHPSMLQDVLAGRPTEIEATFGQVAALGRARGVATPTVDTLLHLVRAIESTYA